MWTWAVCLGLSAVLMLGAEEAPAPLPSPPVTEILNLHSSGFSAEIMLAWLERQPSFAELDAAAVKRLRESKVPEPVVQTLIQRGGQRSTDAVIFLRVYEVTLLAVPERAKSLLTEADYEGLENSEVARVLEVSRQSYWDAFVRTRPYVLGTHFFPYSPYRPLPYASSRFYYPRHNFLYGAYRYPYYCPQSGAYEYPHYHYYYGDRYFYQFGNRPLGGYRIGGVRVGPVGSLRR